MREPHLPALTLGLMILCGCTSGAPDTSQTPRRADASATPAKPPQQTTGATTGDRKTRRLVVLGGALTEIVFALGHGEEVVGVDRSSSWPPALRKRDVPRVGYYRKITAESVLALRPTEVWSMKGLGPATAVEQLRDAKVPVRMTSAAEDLTAARARIKEVGGWLGEEARAAKLLGKLDATLETVKANRSAATRRPRALFLYARGPNVLLVAGAKTSADAMMSLAGLENAVQDVEGFKPLTPEAVIKAAPELIVVPAHGAQSIGGVDGVFRLPGMAHTPAAKARRVVMIDDLKLLGFGPRAAEALLELQAAAGVVKAGAPQPGSAR